MTRRDAGDATTKLVPSGGDSVLSLLIVASGPPRVVPLAPGAGIRIGRAATADVVLDDESLSRHHATFWLRDGAVEVEDLDSSNGTIVRGQRVPVGQPARLAVGEVVHLGAILVVIQLRSGPLAERLRPAASASLGDELVARIAASTISVLVLGETGVGKEVMAERLHAESPRRHLPLVKLNCAALMSSVLESELFGHERGAFTGAVKDKPGLIESADGGTLFLDEIGEADPSVQVKLLRVLEARETQRIGAIRPRVVDVRFIAATNRVPGAQIQAGTLRADLYYRLAGFAITIPPLRDRRDQIASLATELLSRHASSRGPITLHPEAVARLVRHDWPGNVRELRNVLDRAVVLADRPQLGLAEIDQALQLEPRVEGGSGTASLGPAASADPERDRVLAVLEACGGNQTIAAQRLAMSRRALVYRLQAWGLTRPRRR